MRFTTYVAGAIVSKRAAVYLAAELEYISAEILELAGNAAKGAAAQGAKATDAAAKGATAKDATANNTKAAVTVITPWMINRGVRDDEELDALFPGLILGGGVQSHIQALATGPGIEVNDVRLKEHLQEHVGKDLARSKGDGKSAGIEDILGALVAGAPLGSLDDDLDDYEYDRLLQLGADARNATHTALSAMTYREIQAELKRRGLSTKGKTDVLMARLADAMATSAASASAEGRASAMDSAAEGGAHDRGGVAQPGFDVDHREALAKIALEYAHPFPRARPDPSTDPTLPLAATVHDEMFARECEHGVWGLMNSEYAFPESMACHGAAGVACTAAADAAKGGKQKHSKHRMHLRDNLGCITASMLRSLAARAGIIALSGDCYEEIRSAIRCKLEDIVRAATTCVEHHKSTTATVPDVLTGVQQLGGKLYGTGLCGALLKWAARPSPGTIGNVIYDPIYGGTAPLGQFQSGPGLRAWREQQPHRGSVLVPVGRMPRP